jgi:hypothetical protein
MLSSFNLAMEDTRQLQEKLLLCLGSLVVDLHIILACCRFRTSLCSLGTSCDRPVCFFAHLESELRTPPATLSEPAAIPGAPQIAAAAATAAGTAALRPGQSPMSSPGFPGTPTSEPTTPTYGSPLNFNFADLDMQLLQQRAALEGQQAGAGVGLAAGVEQWPVGAVSSALRGGRQASPPLPGSPGLVPHTASGPAAILQHQPLQQQQQQQGGVQPTVVPIFASANAAAAASGGAGPGAQASRVLGVGGLPPVIAAEEATSVDHFLARSNLLIIAPPGTSKEGTPSGSPLLPRSPQEAAAGGGGGGVVRQGQTSSSGRVEGFVSGVHHHFAWPGDVMSLGPGDHEDDDQEVSVQRGLHVIRN